MGSDFDGRMARETEEIICRLKAAAQRPTYAELDAENARLRAAYEDVARQAVENAREALAFGMQRDRLHEALAAADYFIDRLSACHAGKVVRDLDEAAAAYAAIRPTAPATEQEKG